VGGLTRLAWRTLAARPVRTALTTIGIALGVAVLFAGLLTRAGIERSVTAGVSDLLGRADLRVAAFADAGLDRDAVAAIASAPGVAAAAPRIERRTYLAATSAPPGHVPSAVTVLGIDPALDGRLHDLPIRDGAALAADARAVLVSATLAAEAGLGPGSDLRLDGSVDASPSDLRFNVAGVLAGDLGAADPAGRVVVMSLDAADLAFAPIGVSSIDVAGDGTTNADALAAEVGRRLTAQPYVVSTPAALAASLRASAAEFQVTTALVAAVALFAGAFLIFNTLSMTVVERFREVGLLRAAGATRRQVVTLVLAAATVLGVAGSIAGIALGWALAAAMAGGIEEVSGLRLAAAAPGLDAVAVAFVVGLAVTLAAAAEPAVRASEVPPVEALRPPTSLAPSAASLRWLVAVFVVVGVAGLLLVPSGGGLRSIVPAAASYLVLFAVALAVPWLVRPLGRLAGLPFALVVRAEERLARGALLRDRGRATLTVGALAVGLATIVALGAFAAGARGDAETWISSVVPGDLVATSVTPRPLDEGLVAELGASPGVARVSPLARFDVAFRGLRLDAAAVVGADVLADGRLAFVDGDRTAGLAALDTGGSVVVPEALATRFGIQVGDDLGFPTGDAAAVDLRVVGIVARSLPGRAGEAILVGWNDATTGFGVTGATSFAVRFRPAATAAERDALVRLATADGLEPTSLESLEGAVGDALGRVFGVFDGLALLAVLIGGLGIANTLSMSVLERVRELAVLRAAGMTRRQVWRMVVVEAGLLGLIGVAVGVVGGVAAGGLLATIGAGFPAPLVPWPSIGLAVVLGVGVSMLAAAYPAWLAARVSIARAVRAE
jgi:putative ABC transport system permease protein